MADASLHFAVGMAAGILCQTPALRRAWGRTGGVAVPLTRWITVSWALGFWAIVPSLLRYSGLPGAFCSGWWMNLFLLHPLINRFGPHATIIGAAAMVAGFALQYTIILTAIARWGKRGGAGERCKQDSQLRWRRD